MNEYVYTFEIVNEQFNPSLGDYIRVSVSTNCRAEADEIIRYCTNPDLKLVMVSSYSQEFFYN